MAEKIRIELNSEGVRELLKSPEIMSVCKGHADRIAGRAGGGYEVTRRKDAVEAFTDTSM